MVELEPYCVLVHGCDGEPRSAAAALWRPDTTSQPALALFSTYGKARTYAEAQQLKVAGNMDGAVVQFRELQLVKLLMEAYKQGVTHAVLDPDDSQARSLFEIRDVLRSARQQLTLHSPPSSNASSLDHA